MSAPLRKNARRSPGDANLPRNGGPLSPSTPPTESLQTAIRHAGAPAASTAPMGMSPPLTNTAKRLGSAPFRRPSSLQASAAGTRAGGGGATARASSGLTGGSGGTAADMHGSANIAAVGSSLRKGSPAPFGRSPNARLRQPYSATTAVPGCQSPAFAPATAAHPVGAGTSPPLPQRSSLDGVTPRPAFPGMSPAPAATPSSSAAGVGASTPTAAADPQSTLTSVPSVSGLSNHLRLSEGLSCLDYHAGFRALAVGSTRQIHVVEVMPMVGHDVAAAVRQRRHRQAPSSAGPEVALDGEGPSSSSSPTQPPPLASAPFLLRNTGVFGGLIKVESVAWYPSTEEASLAFIQPGRTVTIFLDAIQFKADGTYLPQQWTRSQYKGKTLTSAMAAGGGSTTMAVVANLDCTSGGVTPATSTTSLGGASGLYTPVSAPAANAPSFAAASLSHMSTPHEAGLPTPMSGSAGFNTAGMAASNLPYVIRDPKGPLAKELIELNIDITYMRVEKIVWDPHHPYTLALSSPATHFEVWQVPTDGNRVYAPQLVLRPPAHNTRSVVRDVVFSPSNPDLIIVVTECGNAGQVLLYDRRQVEAMRYFDVSGPGLSAAFHPLFSDLVAVCFRREKTKPDTRISFLQVVTDSGSVGGAGGDVGGVGTGVCASTLDKSPTSTLLPASVPAGTATTAAPPPPPSAAAGPPVNSILASVSPHLAEQPYLSPIDNYACISRMRWRPPSMGRLADPKRHHYLSFRPSAQALWAARNLQSAAVPSVTGGFTWADLLHSQLWFASAAMTTDTDLSIWDATNGFFPVCAVKYLSPRGDAATNNESNDFIWLNELTMVSIFKSGDMVCTSFINSLLECSVMTSAERAQLRTTAPQQQQQLQRHRLHVDSKARDEHGELYSRRIAEEETCLAMVPAYTRDPYADLFLTFTVLPTTSIVSDLFGHSYTVRNTNVALRRYYQQMIRRECGQLIRRLAIQVTKEAVLRQQWTTMRSAAPGSGSATTGPSTLSGLAALQELRARRPRSPFTQTNIYHGRATSSQGSDSTPPSPRRSMLTRRYSVASSLSSMSARLTTSGPTLGGRASTGPVAARGSSGIGPGLSGGQGRGSGYASGGTSDLVSRSPHHVWSLEDMSEAGGPATTAPPHAAQLGLRQQQRSQERGRRMDGGAADQELVPDAFLRVRGDGGVLMDDGLDDADAHSPHASSSPYPELVDHDAGVDAGAVDLGDDNQGDADDVDGNGLRRQRGGSRAMRWVARLLGFSRRERVQRYCVSEAHRSTARSGDASHAEYCGDAAVLVHGLSAPPELAGSVRGADEAEDGASAPPRTASTTLAAASRAHSAQTPGDGPLGTGPLFSQSATWPITVAHHENSDSSTGSPRQVVTPGAPASTAQPRGTHAVGAATAAAPPPSRGLSTSPGAPAPGPGKTAALRVGSGGGSSRGGPGGSSSLLHASASTGALPTGAAGGGNGSGSGVAPGDLDGNASLAGSAGSAAALSYRRARGGVVFTQLFPLLEECVYVRGGAAPASASGPNGLRRKRATLRRGSYLAADKQGNASASVSPGTAAAQLTSATAAAHAVASARVSPTPASPTSPDSDGSSTPTRLVRQLHPPVLTSPGLHPADVGLGDDTTPLATTSPLQLPLPMPVPLTGYSAAGSPGGLLPAGATAAAGPAAKRTSPGTAPPPAAAAADGAAWHLVSAHAYLVAQRDVTAAVESFVLGDAVCGWSYAEMQAEQEAFVRFALEWEMGYELALAMKALRHKRADAEAAAKSGAAPPPAQPMGGGGEGPMLAQDVDAFPAAMRPRGLPRNSSAGAAAAGSEAGRRTEWRPSAAAAAQRDRKGLRIAAGAGAGHSAPQSHSADPSRMVDWGNGVPVPTHEDVDDKVAAMMEANARICERVQRLRQASSGQGEGGAAAVAARGSGAGGRGATAEADAEGGETSNPQGPNPTPAAAAAPPAGAPASPAAADPRAQWWRAAAHAWRSHHVSFIISITTQQLEYAALMGDVQYSLVLYILFCVWWRLHSEVAEAAYAVASTAAAAAALAPSDGSHDEDSSHHAGADTGSAHSGSSRPPSARQKRRGSGPAAGAADKPRRGTAGHREGQSFNNADDGADDSEDDADSERGAPSAEAVERLRLLCRFFLRCPLMPPSPEVHAAHPPCPDMQSSTGMRTSGSIGALSSAGGAGELRDRLNNSPLPSGALTLSVGSVGGPRLMGGGGGGGGALVGSLGGAGAFLRTSASSPSLPSRSQNNSSRRLNETPSTPAMAASIGDGRGGHRTSSNNLLGLGAGPMAGAAAAAQALLRADAMGDRSGAAARSSAAAATASGGGGAGAAAGGAGSGLTSLEGCNAYVDIAGLRGVRLYARVAEDLCASQDCYCPPAEWKLRALQWLETYTADLYARQLYVPLNELLLVMPEIFREPTNPVQPRAADIAYEKQMTYVYCGGCSKAELWSRTPQDAVPAAVRLYDRVLQRGHHSSSSERSDDTDTEEEEGEASRPATVPGSRGRDTDAHASTSRTPTSVAEAAAARRQRRRQRSRRSRLQQQQRRRAHQRRGVAAIRRGSTEYDERGVEYAEGSSSDLSTPAVESPTSSSLCSSCRSCSAVHDRALAGSPASTDVSLSSEHSTRDHRGASATELYQTASSLEHDHHSPGAGAGAGRRGGGSGNATARVTVPVPAIPAVNGLDVAASATSAAATLPPLRTRDSRPHLDDLLDERPQTSAGPEWGDDGADAGQGSSPTRRRRCTAVGCSGCGDAAPTANNATCAKCSNRTAMTCVICEEVVEGVFFWLRSCGHGGHVHHMEEWLRYSHECPRCGVPITQTWKGG